ncbi:MAG: hypothetical protein IJZ34_12310 [Lachnospiraceae bacterium]|nr:hypothetical protein [Lachnospiraceae bacterium]
MSQKHYDAAVLGATFLGIGAALSLKNVVIIEKGGLVSESGEIYPAPAVYVASSYLEENPMDILLVPYPPLQARKR